MALSTATQEEFLRLLDQHEEFRQQVRQRILSTELFELPERFAAFASRVNEFIVRQEKFNAEQREINARVDKRLQRISDDIGDLKGHAALRATRDHSATILERLGLEYVTILYRRELIDLSRQATDISTGDRQSFIRADLMLQGEAADGTTHYVAAEASYTADRRDTDRALRNAEFLKRLTGYPAHAVISSLENDLAVQSLVDDGTVHWFQLTDKDLDPE